MPKRMRRTIRSRGDTVEIFPAHLEDRPGSGDLRKVALVLDDRVSHA